MKKEYSFILSDNFRSLTKNILEISLLKKILSIKNVQLNFYKETKFKSDIIPRKEIREILKKHWNSDNFRDVSFYKNPDKGSAETITIKQDF